MLSLSLQHGLRLTFSVRPLAIVGYTVEVERGELLTSCLSRCVRASTIVDGCTCICQQPVLHCKWILILEFYIPFGRTVVTLVDSAKKPSGVHYNFSRKLALKLSLCVGGVHRQAQGQLHNAVRTAVMCSSVPTESSFLERKKVCCQNKSFLSLASSKSCFQVEQLSVRGRM